MIRRPVTGEGSTDEIRDKQRRPEGIGKFYFQEHRVRRPHGRVQGEFKRGEGNGRRSVDDVDAFLMPSTGTVQSSGTGQVRVRAAHDPVQPHSVDDAVGDADQDLIYREPPLIAFHQFRGPHAESRAEVVQPFDGQCR